MKPFVILVSLGVAAVATAKEYRVGADRPLKTISAAAELAQPGDTITVHAGIYRERVTPPRGHVVYQAAPGEQVTITGSEPVKGWTHVTGNVWRVAIPNTVFGDFNPFADLIAGDWFHPQGRRVHAGAVYCDGRRLTEARALADTLNPKGNGLFFAEVGGDRTTLHAQFSDQDPNAAQVEVNVRQTVFYPATNFIDCITVRGFILQNAAPNWAAPTVEQKAIIGPNWAKGWVIENNIIRNSSCAGVSLGKFGDDWNGPGGPGYTNWNLVIARALKNGWNKETVGHHIVRNNEIRDCDEVGIVGAFGCAFSVVERNHIHDIGTRQLFGGAELAGIKFHGAVDTLIRDNWIHHCIRGMHMDWMTQGTQIAGNLMHNNDGRASGSVGFYEAGGGQDLFLEVNHGPCIVANNILLSAESVFNASHGTVFAHNLLRGITPTTPRWLPRKTPFLVPHGTAPAGEFDNRGGDDRFFNNIFVANSSLAYFNRPSMPVIMEGNVFTEGTAPSIVEKDPVMAPDFDRKPAMEIRGNEAFLRLAVDAAWGTQRTRRLVTGGILGLTVTAKLPFENPDGSPVVVDTDYLGRKRDPAHPFPGPFETPVNGEIKVWPKP